MEGERKISRMQPIERCIWPNERDAAPFVFLSVRLQRRLGRWLQQICQREESVWLILKKEGRR